MPLSEDQRAMLQLLLQRRQSYEDIGSLLGLEVDEVRARARAALAEIGGEDPDRSVGLTDYLLGQADPIGRADVARHLQSEPDSRALAEQLLAQLRLLAPDADLPSLPAGKPTRSARPAKAAGQAQAAERPRREPGPSLSSLSGRQRRLIGALLGGGLLVAIVVLLATGALSGDDGEAEPTAASTDAVAEQTGDETGATESRLTRAVLTSQGGGEARGVALFGRVRDVPVLEVRAVGLQPSGQGRSYSVWLYQSDRVALRVGAVKVGESGRILSQVPLPAQALGFVANGTFGSIVVSLTDDRAFAAEVREAEQGRRLPRFLGQPVMRGPIQGPGVDGAGAEGGG